MHGQKEYSCNFHLQSNGALQSSVCGMVSLP